MKSETARREIESLDYYLQNHTNDYSEESHTAMMMAIDALSSSEKPNKWIPISEKYEYHIDHTDCIWYGNDRGCPVTCSQYRDGWNDAMDYIFKNGDGYRPYRRNENG